MLGLAEGRHLQCALVALIFQAGKAQCPLGGLRSFRQRLSKNDVGASHHAAAIHLAFGGAPAALTGRNWKEPLSVKLCEDSSFEVLLVKPSCAIANAGHVPCRCKSAFPTGPSSGAAESTTLEGLSRLRRWSSEERSPMERLRDACCLSICTRSRVFKVPHLLIQIQMPLRDCGWRCSRLARTHSLRLISSTARL